MTDKLGILLQGVEKLVSVYEIVEESDFNKDIQREIQKAAMKTGEKVLFETEANAELMSADYKLAHIRLVRNILDEMEEEVQEKRFQIIDDLNIKFEGEEVKNVKNKKQNS